jgi:hypothetical protein
MSESGKAVLSIAPVVDFTMRRSPCAGSRETITHGFGGQLTRGKIAGLIPGKTPHFNHAVPD